MENKQTQQRALTRTRLFVHLKALNRFSAY